MSHWRQCLGVLSGLCLLVLPLLGEAATPPASRAQASTPQVQATLLATQANVVPGDTLTLGVRLAIQPHWHTYWRNPGDSGTVTTIDWAFSGPAEAGDIQWPLPDRFKMGPIVNYGYADQVTLPVPVHISSAVQVGEVLQAQAVVDWLVCKEECIPQQVTLALSLPVVAASQRQLLAQPDITAALASQPQPADWPVRVLQRGQALTLQLDAPALKQAGVSDVWFYPDDWGVIAQSQAQLKTDTEHGIALTLQSGDVPLRAGDTLSGILVIRSQQAGRITTRGISLSPVLATTGAATAAIPSAPPQSTTAFLLALALAFVGGLVLNLMPCVFPVLSIKALSLLSHATLGRGELIKQGLVYTAGVVVSFVSLALVLVALKASGAQVGWGFQFQSPYFVFAMVYLLFAVGLNLSGVFTIGGRVSGIGSQLADKPGYWGSFFTGVLATVVATPCTAPFMAAALGYALTRPALELTAVFVSLGLGLAFPYLLLTSWPSLQRRLPRPGAWMEVAKQFFAFPMYAAAVWLVWVLAQQQGEQAVALVLTGLVLIAFAAWVYAISRRAEAGRKWLANGTVWGALCLSFSLVGLLEGSSQPSQSKRDQAAGQQPVATTHWQPYSAEKLQALRAAGKPVFLNMTAAWCISCLVNERVALSQPAVVQAFAQHGITYLKGDWTNKDAEITKILTSFGRSGVPLYVFYPAGRDATPLALPQILTPATVLSSLQFPSH